MNLVIFEGIAAGDEMPARVAIIPSRVVDIAEFPKEPGCIIRYRLAPGREETNITAAHVNHSLEEVVAALNKVMDYF